MKKNDVFNVLSQYRKNYFLKTPRAVILSTINVKWGEKNLAYVTFLTDKL